MANKQKRLKKFGLAGGRHSSKRKALDYGLKAYKYTSNLKIYIKFERIMCFGNKTQNN